MEDSLSDDQQQKEEDLFYFESDHLALRGNKDYSELLKTLFILTAQRERAFKDYEKIHEIKKSALDDPELFLEKLKNDELGIPPLQSVAQIPFINWYSYNTHIPEDELKAIYSDRSAEKNDSENLGKLGQKNTHKQKWSAEEQKKLEELLLVYPPEPIEHQRIKKIAAALGNRTVQQVSSRLQKYFLKLHKAGLHVPGRTPKSGSFRKKSKHKYDHLHRPSTFFPEYNVSVSMDNTESAPGPSSQEYDKSTNSNTSNYLLPTEYYQPDAVDEDTEKPEIELQAELLKRIRAEKEREIGATEPYRHFSFKCDYCSEEPILGTRWHCSSCIQESIDFCTDCLIQQLYSDKRHPLSHKFVTLPDDPNSNMSSDSDSESANETSNNYDISDSDVSARSSLSSLKLKKVSSSNGTISRPVENGLKNDTKIFNVDELDRYPKTVKYAGNLNPNMCSTQDVAYGYLHSNLSLNE